jgi:rubrerythrin
MDLKWVLTVAIEREEEAVAGYAALARDAQDKQLRKLFLKMSKEEKQHLTALQKLDPEGAGGLLPKPTSLHKIRKWLRKSPAAPTAGVRDALRFAIEKEKGAWELYEELANVVKGEEAAAMFRVFSAMEGQHSDWLEALERELPSA